MKRRIFMALICLGMVMVLIVTAHKAENSPVKEWVSEEAALKTGAAVFDSIPEQETPVEAMANTEELSEEEERAVRRFPNTKFISIGDAGEPYLDEETRGGNPDEGKWYCWEERMAWLDNERILIRLEYFHDWNGKRKGSFRQEIICVASAPDYTVETLARINCDEGFRMMNFIPVDDGAVFEAGGILYLLSADTMEIEPICDIASMLGDLYWLSTMELETDYDLSADAKRLLVCTDEGLYEYSLEDFSRRLLVESAYQYEEYIPAEGDCRCGEPDFRFEGPIQAWYAPDEKSILCEMGDEYGSNDELMLIDMDGNELMRFDEYMVGASYFMDETSSVCLAVFSKSQFDAQECRMQVVRPDLMTVSEHVIPADVFAGRMARICVLDSDTVLYCDESMKKYHFSDGTESIVMPFLEYCGIGYSYEEKDKWIYGLQLSPDGQNALFGYSAVAHIID